MKPTFEELMPGYRVFQITDTEGNVHLMDTDAIAKSLDDLHSKPDMTEVIEQIHSTMIKRRHEDDYNELLQMIAEMIFAKHSGAEQMKVFIARHSKRQKKTVDPVTISRLAKALCGKMAEFKVSRNTKIVLVERSSGKTKEFNIRQVIGGLVTGQTDFDVANEIAEMVESCTTEEEALTLVSKLSVEFMDEIEAFDVDEMDEVVGKVKSKKQLH